MKSCGPSQVIPKPLELYRSLRVAVSPKKVDHFTIGAYREPFALAPANSNGVTDRCREPFPIGNAANHEFRKRRRSVEQLELTRAARSFCVDAKIAELPQEIGAVLRAGQSR